MKATDLLNRFTILGVKPNEAKKPKLTKVVFPLNPQQIWADFVDFFAKNTKMKNVTSKISGLNKNQWAAFMGSSDKDVLVLKYITQDLSADEYARDGDELGSVDVEVYRVDLNDKDVKKMLHKGSKAYHGDAEVIACGYKDSSASKEDEDGELVVLYAAYKIKDAIDLK